MRFLIAGLGSVGRRHLRNLLSLGHKDVILLRTGLSTLPDEDLAGIPVEKDIRLALSRRSPDAVIVSNPTAMHLDVAIPAAEAGCHLLIEKPISHNMLRIDELRAALQKGGGRLLMGFQYRFHPGLLKAKDLIDQEAVGAPISARAHYGDYLPDWHPWEDYSDSYASRRELGGGVLLTLCHPFDYLRWFFGDAVRISGTSGTFGNLVLDTEDLAEVFVLFHKLTLASVHLNFLQRPRSHWLEVIGTDGTLRWDESDGVVRWWRAGNGEWKSCAPGEGFERNMMFLEEMSHFIAVVEGREEPVSSLEDGIKALEIAISAGLASRSM